jgi:hypothetical protein
MHIILDKFWKICYTKFIAGNSGKVARPLPSCP